MKYQPLLRAFEDCSYGPRVSLSLDAWDCYVLSFTDFGIHLFKTYKPRGVALNDDGRARVFKGSCDRFGHDPVVSEVEFRGVFIQARQSEDQAVEITTSTESKLGPSNHALLVTPSGIYRYSYVDDAKKLLWPTDDKGRLLVLRGDHDFNS